MMRLRTRRAVAAIALSALVAVSGCGLKTSGGFVPQAELAGATADVASLDGATIAVGSKNLTENIILGKMLLILFQAAGADVTDLTNIPGSTASRQAHLDGQIDAMWDYTGTGWITYLGNDAPIPDPTKQYEAVRDADLEQNGIVWLPPATLNNTYGFALTEESSKKYGITKLSEIKKLPPADQTYCVDTEFANRSDGLSGMLKTYGLTATRDQINTYLAGALYDATVRGDCVIGMVTTTDGRILALNLSVLADDQSYFPTYNVAIVLRQDLLEEYPQIEEMMAPLTEQITDDEMMTLNARVDVEGEEPADVAAEWLVDKGFITQ